MKSFASTSSASRDKLSYLQKDDSIEAPLLATRQPPNLQSCSRCCCPRVFVRLARTSSYKILNKNVGAAAVRLGWSGRLAGPQNCIVCCSRLVAAGQATAARLYRVVLQTSQSGWSAAQGGRQLGGGRVCSVWAGVQLQQWRAVVWRCCSAAVVQTEPAQTGHCSPAPHSVCPGGLQASELQQPA